MSNTIQKIKAIQEDHLKINTEIKANQEKISELILLRAKLEGRYESLLEIAKEDGLIDELGNFVNDDKGDTSEVTKEVEEGEVVDV